MIFVFSSIFNKEQQIYIYTISKLIRKSLNTRLLPEENAKTLIINHNERYREFRAALPLHLHT